MYIFGDEVSYILVKGWGKFWLDKEINDLIWKNIFFLIINLIDYGYDVVVDYVVFLEDIDGLIKKLVNYDVRIVYVVLLVDC